MQSQPNKLFLDRLPPRTSRAFLEFAKLKLFSRSQWYLAGGTALALQVGHRQSVDLDFFTPRNKFSELQLERALLGTKQWTTSFRQTGTIYGAFKQAKTSFIAYPFFVPAVEFLRYGSLRILRPEDIAAMKIIAISQRGRKRDFVDLYWYCTNRENLAEVIRRAVRQYPGQKHNIPHFIKSMTYFADAEVDPMPRLFFDASWQTIKKFLSQEAAQAMRELLNRE